LCGSRQDGPATLTLERRQVARAPKNEQFVFRHAVPVHREKEFAADDVQRQERWGLGQHNQIHLRATKGALQRHQQTRALLRIKVNSSSRQDADVNVGRRVWIHGVTLSDRAGDLVSPAPKCVDGVELEFSLEVVQD
jgi:hypothetical protein